MTKNMFALGISNHRVWGELILPFFIGKEKINDVFRLSERILPCSKNFSCLTVEQKDLVRITEAYNDRQLYKLFSKEKNVRQFINEVSKEKKGNIIRPYIEKHLFNILNKVTGSDIRFFIKEPYSESILPGDFLKLETSPAEPVFHFSRKGEGSLYFLTLQHADKELDLQSDKATVICREPAVIRLGGSIYFIKDISGKKLEPFFNRDFIRIPVSTERKYFKTFVYQAVLRYRVRAEGFSIKTKNPKLQHILSVERNLKSEPVVIPKFRYNQTVILPNNNQKLFLNFEEKKGEYVFSKYYRDPDWENKLHEYLKNEGLRAEDGIHYQLVKSENDTNDLFALINWVNRHAEQTKEFGIEVLQRLGEDSYYTGKVLLEMKTSEGIDWFDLFAEVWIGEYKFPFIKFRRNILDGKREFVLPDKTVAVLPSEWFVKYRPLFEFGKEKNNRLRIKKQHFSLIDNALKGEQTGKIRKLKKLTQMQQLPQKKLPVGLRAVLRMYQKEGFLWMAYLQENRLGGCLADDMGLGKTLQAITLLQKNKEDQTVPAGKRNDISLQPTLFPVKEISPTSLVVVPASLVHNWVHEISKFVPGMSVYSYIGNQRKKNTAYLSGYDIVVSSYHTVRQDIEILRSFGFHYVILDESQLIKNPSSKLYRAMVQLQSEYRLVLTGTPIENSLTDLWAQMNFINQGLLGTLRFFKNEFVTPIEKNRDKQKEKYLTGIISPFILRRTKDEVVKELPPINENNIYCTMSDDQYRLYEEEKSVIRNRILHDIESEGMEKSTIIVLQGLIRLRQMSNHPRMVNPGYSGNSGKFSEICRNLENVLAEGHKVLVFSSFVEHLKLIAGWLEEEKLPYVMLTGATRNREKVINEFRQEKIRIFLVSLKVGGLGLNLTEADYVFILDPWWNPAAELQAMNRTHRIGQKKNVFVYRFISVDSIEEKILRLQEKKARLAKTFVHSNNPLSGISRDQIMSLFE